MRSTRREFLKSSLGATALAGFGAIPARAAKRTATDWVTLGHSGVQVTRLAFGTGTHGGRVQRELGQEEFTKLVRHAYDRGIRFFETAESYHGMPQMLATALKGIPRDTYKLMSKCNTREMDDPQASIDRQRKDCGTEYFDVLLFHCMRRPTWSEDLKRLEDAFSEAKSKRVLLAHGASVHGLPALRSFPGNRWLDIAMIRMNHTGWRMDTEQMGDTNDLGAVSEVVAHAKKVHAQGAGVISMKLAGEGTFTRGEEREAALKFVMNTGAVDSVTIGFKSTAEIDEAIERLNRVLA